MKRPAWAFATAALALLGLEGVCHAWPAPTIADTPRPGGESPMMNGNPWLLWELIPGEHRENGGHVTVNRAGFRDRERAAKTGPRALALGDSSIYGFGNDDDEVFTARLEASLGVEVINGGVPGYSTFQALNLLEGRGFALEPDLLLVGTLWSDNNFDSFTDKELLASYAGWAGSGAGVVRGLLQSSSLFRRLDYAVRVAPRSEQARKVGWTVGGTDARTGTRRVALQDYAQNLDRFCTLMAGRGGVVFVLLANREDIDPRSPDPAWRPYRDAMRTAATRCNALLVDVPAAFRESGHSADALFLDLMHPTPLGHRVLAAAIEATLTRSGWPATPLRVQAPYAPLPALQDPYEGRGGAVSTVSTDSVAVRLTLPQPAPAGSYLVALTAAGGGDLLGSVALAPGVREARVRLSTRTSQVQARVTLDRAGDGPDATDPQLLLGPLSLADAGLDLDVRPLR